jgi:RNA polymerase sigma-70 factor (ECF subfamily)
MPTTTLIEQPSTLRPATLEKHLDHLFRAALGMTGRRDDAEDLVQETCARVLARPRIVNGDPLPYLLQVLRNTHHSRWRYAARRPVAPAAPEDLDLHEARGVGDPHRALETREVFARVAALPEAQREVIVAVDLLGLSYAEAAGSLDIPIGTVMSRLHRGRAAVAAA